MLGLLAALPFALIGAFLIFAAYKDWNFLIEHRQSKKLLEAMGRENLRIFYTVIGIALVLVAIPFATGMIDLSDPGKPSNRRAAAPAGPCSNIAHLWEAAHR